MHATSTFQALISADGSSPKSNCERVVDLLDDIIDGEASPEDHHYFFEHLAACKDCFVAHNKQQQLKSFLQDNIRRKTVPLNLMGSIKTIIHETV